MELFYLTAVPQLTLELRSVPTSLSYSNPLGGNLVGGGIMTSRKEAKTLFAALLQRALSFLYLPLTSITSSRSNQAQALFCGVPLPHILLPSPLNPIY